MTRPCYFSFFFSSRRRHTRCSRDWSSDVCSSDLQARHDAVFLERRKSSRNLASQKGDPMTHENNLMTVRQFDGNAYKSSQTAELTLNAAILRAEIARSYEEFLEIFDKFYADDVEVSSEDSPETIHGKERVRPFLLNFLVPLHVMAEVAGLSMSVQLTQVPRDSANETHSEWRIDRKSTRLNSSHGYISYAVFCL